VAPDLLGVSCPTSHFCAAVGDDQQQFGSASIAETWNGDQWTLQSFPVPDGSQSPGLIQVSCTSATFCEAVGSYIDSDFNTVPLAAAWNGTSWALQPTPGLPSTAGFTAVSCTSPSFCEAWGGGNPGNPGPEVAEQWNGASWQLQAVPSGAAAVNSVSCVGASFCEAVGTGAADSWDGSQWSAQTLPSSVSSADLTSVSCSSPRLCETVGKSNVNGNIVGVAAGWNGSEWSAQPVPNPAGATFASLNAVSCASARSCEAAGDHFNSPGDQVNLAEIWNGTRWLIKATPNLKSQDGLADSELNSVSCASASFCQAVGTGPTGPTAALWNGTSWTVQAVPGPAVEPQEVSCATADFCMSADGFGDVDTWNGSAWSAGTSVTGFPFIGSISCLSASFCEVVGEGPSGENAAMWNGTSWTAQPTPGPASNSLSAISCNAVSSCEAVGQMLGANDETVPLAEAWDGSAWTIQSSPDPANSQGSTLAAVSCTAADSCTAAGRYQSSSIPNFGKLQTLAEVWDGTTWSIPATPDPSSAGQNILSGVSCSATDACMAVGQAQDPGGIPATLIEAGD
jgi:hypothetical protein